MNVTVRPIEPRDAEEIAAIGLATPELHVQDKIARYYTADEIRSFIQSPHDIYLVAEVNGKIAGYRLATVNMYLKEAYLLDLVVKPEFRKMGVAAALYAKTFEMLKEKNCAWAWCIVSTGNDRMVKYLQKMGFQTGKEFRFMYIEYPFMEPLKEIKQQE